MYRNEDENPGNAKHQLGLFSEESLMSIRCLDTTADENVATFNVRTCNDFPRSREAYPGIAAELLITGSILKEAGLK